MVMGMMVVMKLVKWMVETPTVRVSGAWTAHVCAYDDFGGGGIAVAATRCDDQKGQKPRLKEDAQTKTKCEPNNRKAAPLSVASASTAAAGAGLAWIWFVFWLGFGSF
jgi:hypothetical protein